MLQLFGGVSQTIGRFRSVAVVAGTLAALALNGTLIFGNLVERRRELAILRVIGWGHRQVQRQIAAEMALQGLLGAVLALGFVVSPAIYLPMSASCCRRTCPAKTRDVRRGRLSGRRQRRHTSGVADRVGLAAGAVRRHAHFGCLGLADVVEPDDAEPVVRHEDSLKRPPHRLALISCAHCRSDRLQPGTRTVSNCIRSSTTNLASKSSRPASGMCAAVLRSKPAQHDCRRGSGVRTLPIAGRCVRRGGARARSCGAARRMNGSVPATAVPMNGTVAAITRGFRRRAALNLGPGTASRRDARGRGAAGPGIAIRWRGYRRCSRHCELATARRPTRPE